MNDSVIHALKQQVWLVDTDVTTKRMIQQTVIEELDLAEDYFKDPSIKREASDIIAEQVQLRLDSLEAGSPQNEQHEKETASATADLSDDFKLNESELDSDGLNVQQAKKPSGEKRKKLSNGIDSIKNMGHVSKASPKHRTSRSKASGKNADKIAQLKTWLLRCGVRKQWHRLLNPLPTDAEKIQYLEDQLSQIGMTKRYSLVKAKTIKDQRELQAELAEITDNNVVVGDASKVTQKVGSL